MVGLDADHSCLNVACLIGGSFVVLQGGAYKDRCSTVGRAIWVVAVVGGVAGQFED